MLVDKLPPHQRQSYGMSRTLGVDRSVCQRVVTALKATGQRPGLEVLARVPGIDGLTSFIGAFRDRGLPVAAIDAATAAAEQVHALIKDVSGSHARLRARINATLTAAGTESDSKDEVESRRRMCADATRICGVHTRVLAYAGCVRPLPNDPTSVEFAMAKGLIGYSARPGGMALYEILLHSGNLSPMAQERQGNASSPPSFVHTLVPELSTQPLPMVTGPGPGGNTIELIDASRSSELLDVVVTKRSPALPHPATHEDRVLTSALRIKVPTNRLIFDTYVHRSIAAAAKPAAGAYLWNHMLLSDPRKCWYDRLPGMVRLEVLPDSAQSASTLAWPHHRRMTELLFDELAWPRDEFIGYRIDIEFPVWGSVYAVYFDFDA